MLNQAIFISYLKSTNCNTHLLLDLICNTIKSATSNICKWIDDQLQPLVQKLPSHLKDDNHFLCKLVELNNNHTLPPETILVTWDVKSLYTDIPHDGGMKACDYFMHLHNFGNDTGNLQEQLKAALQEKQ